MKKLFNIIVTLFFIVLLVTSCTNVANTISKAKVKIAYESFQGCLKRCDELFAQSVKTYRADIKSGLDQYIKQLNNYRNLPATQREESEKNAEKVFTNAILKSDQGFDKDWLDHIQCIQSCNNKFPSEMGF